MRSDELTADAPDATDLLAGYRAGHIDPVKVAESHLARIEQVDRKLNAFSARATDVLDRAIASRERWMRGTPAGTLDGIPIIIKDNLVSAGLPASWGNPALASRVTGHDELPVAALRDAGVIIVGKGNTPEFAVEGYTGNDTFGATGNPYDPRLTPGGSSGGVVAAVASGMAVAGLATDGGGSIRRPVSYTGLWGLKTGIGSVRRGGGLPQLLLDFETVGPVTRSARDLALIYGVLSHSSCLPAPRCLNILCVAQIDGAPCDAGIRAVFETTVGRLAGIGHKVTAGELPVDLGPINEIWGKIPEVGLAHLMQKDPDVLAAAAGKYRDMATRGASLSAVALYDALNRVYALRETTRGLWGYDAVLTPAAAAMPWPADEVFPARIDGRAVGARGHAVYTGWVNAAGLPAIACPAGFADGLPVGVQFIADHGGERLLLSMAIALENAR